MGRYGVKIWVAEFSNKKEEMKIIEDFNTKKEVWDYVMGIHYDKTYSVGKIIVYDWMVYHKWGPIFSDRIEIFILNRKFWLRQPRQSVSDDSTSDNNVLTHWETRKGDLVLIRDMTTSHLANTIDYIEKNKFRVQYLPVLREELDKRLQTQNKEEDMVKRYEVKIWTIQGAEKQTRERFNESFNTKKEVWDYVVNTHTNGIHLVEELIVYDDTLSCGWDMVFCDDIDKLLGQKDYWLDEQEKENGDEIMVELMSAKEAKKEYAMFVNNDFWEIVNKGIHYCNEHGGAALFLRATDNKDCSKKVFKMTGGYGIEFYTENFAFPQFVSDNLKKNGYKVTKDVGNFNRETLKIQW